jgi:serine protease
VDFLNWNNYLSFIRNNNNVTWRNFNVVNMWQAFKLSDFIDLPWKASGAPDKGRSMQLEVIANLPDGSELMVDGPADFMKLLHVDSSPQGKKRRVARINPSGRHVLGEGLFPAKTQHDMRLRVRIPKKYRKQSFDIHVSQRFKGLEVGRVTWRLVGTEKQETHG